MPRPSASTSSSRWYGAVETARLAAGETVAVFGVSGGVGGAVAQIAHALGANVIGVDRRQPGPQIPAAAVIDDFITFDPAADVGAAIKRLTGGRGVDVVYDAVGGVTTSSALAALAHRGRLVVISAVGPPTVAVNLLDLYHNETRILGTDSTQADCRRLGAAPCSRWRPTSSPGISGRYPSLPRTRSTMRPRHTRPSPTTLPAAS